ncbi:MAG: Shikimate kinase I (EC [uncultured Paraburkholderia sp.]|nr:MAG: Shikimate kinase I (EC [uncultured Paraburkholderia sp.]CAH2921307.1 MAG: Shikimate kinase I (EC [uncultured Paraburkholderia sp.]
MSAPLSSALAGLSPVCSKRPEKAGPKRLFAGLQKRARRLDKAAALPVSCGTHHTGLSQRTPLQARDAHANVFFVGLMGAGKTTVGRAIARRLDRPFFDSDHEIEARTGARIPVIFELEGEAGFREREAHVISDLTGRDSIVLATGGGAVLRPENREALQKNGVVIYLRANPHDLWLRTRRNKNRPLLQTEDPKARLEALYEVRDPLYRECAHFVIETGRPSVNGLVNMVLMQLEMACVAKHPAS